MLGDDGRGGPERGHPPLDGLEVVARERVADHELEHRRARVDEGAHRGIAAREPQVARVEAVGSDGDEGLRREPLLLAEGAHRRLLAGRIAVEREHDLADARVVAEHASQHLDVVDAERRAARGDRGGDAGEVARHDVGVPLDHDDAVGLGDVALGQVEAVEHLRLVVDRRLGSVQVLRALVVVEEPARAEADGLPGDVADGPDQPAAEPVVDAAIALRDESGCRELLGREPTGLEVVGERVPALRREPDAEPAGGLCVESALAEEAAADVGVGRAEALDEELGGGLVGGQEPGAVAVVGRLPAVFVVQLEARRGRRGARPPR